MDKLEGSNRFLLNQQADTIKRMGVMVAKQRTFFYRKELYAIDELLVEISFVRYSTTTLVEKITHIRNSNELIPYLRRPKLEPIQERGELSKIDLRHPALGNHSLNERLLEPPGNCHHYNSARMIN